MNRTAKMQKWVANQKCNQLGMKTLCYHQVDELCLNEAQEGKEEQLSKIKKPESLKEGRGS